jgi:hypothetical protein
MFYLTNITYIHILLIFLEGISVSKLIQQMDRYSISILNFILNTAKTAKNQVILKLLEIFQAITVTVLNKFVSLKYGDIWAVSITIQKCHRC